MERGWQRWRAAGGMVPDAALGDALGGAPGEDLLGGIFAGSPFLTELLVTEPRLLAGLGELGAEAAWAGLLGELEAVDAGDRVRLMAGLRRVRRRAALLIALCDLSGRWSLAEVTAALTALADRAVQRTVDHLLLEAVRRGELAPWEGGASGLVVLAMGKHGAHELNYSSDIDLIVLFDEDRFLHRGSESAMAVAVRTARALAYVLEQPTKDGHVFRTDLRLRPHLPGHPLAISTDAAELYYERHGQNWERAALIKARAVAGDIEAGQIFLRRLQPFIWRRHLDYAAIRDIHSIKRQINAYRGFGTIKVAGHDLKVGRGGIREIEFFAQVQQLILGGRVPGLRASGTLAALAALGERRWIAAEATAELSSAYSVLRGVEHRLQMVADRQTQQIPAREDELERFARFAGFADAAELGAALLPVLGTVERHYAQLFERERDLGAGGSLSFTGTGDDPDTLATLAGMGFKDPVQVSARLRAWHHGHIRATRSTRARELLTELTPAIFRALEQQPDRDAAFRMLDEFVAGLPAGVQLFSLLQANPNLLGLLADLMGAAPRLARRLSGDVGLLEAMLAPDFFDPLPGREALAVELASHRADVRDLEDLLDACRDWARGRQFQAGLQVLLGLSSGAEAAVALTGIAETVLATLLPAAERWLVAQHGTLEGGAFCVLALGKLGSGELTIGSDLDLVFIYDAPPDAASTGARPLRAAAYYARLGQRLVSALTAKTAAGELYEIDTRLRPSGNLGPVACSLANFAGYQLETAQTWEQQALTRARVVAGESGLAGRVMEAVHASIRRRRDPAGLAAAVRAMRERIFREHGQADPWSLKHARGGLVELEFTAQYLVLAHAEGVPGLLVTATAGVFKAAGEAGLLAPEEAGALLDALALFQSLQAVLRLSLGQRFQPKSAPPRLLEALIRAAALATPHRPPPVDFADLEGRLVANQTLVAQIFARACPPEPAA